METWEEARYVALLFEAAESLLNKQVIND